MPGELTLRAVLFTILLGALLVKLVISPETSRLELGRGSILACGATVAARAAATTLRGGDRGPPGSETMNGPAR